MVRKREENNGQLNTTTTATKITSSTSTRGLRIVVVPRRGPSISDSGGVSDDDTCAADGTRTVATVPYLNTCGARGNFSTSSVVLPVPPGHSRRRRARERERIHFAPITRVHTHTHTHTRARRTRIAFHDTVCEGARELMAFPGVSIVTVWGLMMRVPPCTSNSSADTSRYYYYQVYRYYHILYYCKL
ncbi:unnamed protein product [Aphis gossypii]|uniref:Uncharacterized protein n=1 Tax=Aphis gossypii TaxID=80765 RepID=A0A9P0J1E9_APHGO|nr:unnamed protein product [Aphis gossypii]